MAVLQRYLLILYMALYSGSSGGNVYSSLLLLLMDIYRHIFWFSRKHNQIVLCSGYTTGNIYLQITFIGSSGGNRCAYILCSYTAGNRQTCFLVILQEIYRHIFQFFCRKYVEFFSPPTDTIMQTYFQEETYSIVPYSGSSGGNTIYRASFWSKREK